MKIEVWGTGCYNCVRLETLIDEIAGELDATHFEVARVTDEKRILEYIPLEEIPSLLIDGILASAGEIPARETLVEWLSGISVPAQRRVDNFTYQERLKPWTFGNSRIAC